MKRSELIWLVLIILAVLLSGFGVVHAKNQSRALFVELQKVRVDQDSADIEWGRWQLELATNRSLDDITRVAVKRLRMKVPQSADIVVVN